jgi:hypothetical protein
MTELTVKIKIDGVNCDFDCTFLDTNSESCLLFKERLRYGRCFNSNVESWDRCLSCKRSMGMGHDSNK